MFEMRIILLLQESIIGTAKYNAAFSCLPCGQWEYAAHLHFMGYLPMRCNGSNNFYNLDTHKRPACFIHLTTAVRA
jgi:hypothetical protein